MDLSDERQPLATPGTGSTLTLSDKFSLEGTDGTTGGHQRRRYEILGQFQGQFK